MRIWTKLLAHSLALFFWICPQFLRWYFAQFLAWMSFDVLKFRRYTILRNLHIAFPDWNYEKKIKVAHQAMAGLCYNLIEFCLLPIMDEKFMEKRVQFHGLENYERALSQKRGVLLLSWHLGSGDTALNMMALKGIKLNVISKIFSNAFANEFWFGVRRRRGIKFIEPHGLRTPFEILKGCKANEAVLFVIDQFMGKPYGIETTFFGRKTGTAYGLALFAIKTEAPVVPVYTYRDKKLNTHIVFEPEIRLEKNENRDLQIQRMTQKYTDKVEEIVRQYPEQWMWLHRRWKVWE